MPFRMIIVLSLVFVFGVHSGSAQRKYPKVVLLPTIWEKIEFNALEECEGKPKGCAAGFLEQLKIDTGKRPWFNVYPIGERNGKNLTIIFVSHSVNDDDSVTGIRYRLALSLGDVEDRSYTLETLGRQYRCARGRKGWSKALCT